MTVIISSMIRTIAIEFRDKNFYL